MKIFTISDIHGALDMLERAAGLIRSADLVVMAGDLTSHGKTEEARALIESVERRSARVLAVHGNWDSAEITALLDERGCGIHAAGRIMDGIGFFGCGGSSPTPMHTRVEYDEDEITRILNKGYERVKGAEKVVLISHTPPRHTRDRTFLGLHGGSASVRSFIEMNRVDLCLCGHIHEAGGLERLGGTLIANPGSFKRGKYIDIAINGGITARRGRLKRGFFS